MTANGLMIPMTDKATKKKVSSFFVKEKKVKKIHMQNTRFLMMNEWNQSL